MVSFVYFDVGGVVVDDFSGNDKWEDLKRELGINDTNSEAFEQIWKRYEPELCIGRDVETLLPIFNEKLGLKLSNNYSLLAGFVNRFEANLGIWPILDSLKSITQVGLLTNMYPNMFTAILQKQILPEVDWDQIVDSSLESLQNQIEGFSKLAEKRANVPHDEILFVDNGSKHIQEAKAFGWQTYLYDSSNHLVTVAKLKSFLEGLEFQNLNK